MTDKTESWEDVLFRPPKWPYIKEDSTAPGAHQTIRQYGYNPRDLGRLPLQTGYSTRENVPDFASSEVESIQYYSQFQVFRDAMLDKSLLDQTQMVDGCRESLTTILPELSKNQKNITNLDLNTVALKYSDTRARSESVDSAQTAVSLGFGDSPNKVETLIEDSAANTWISQGLQLTNGNDPVSVTCQKTKELQQSNLFAALRLLLVGAILMVMAGELVLYFVVRQTIKFYKQRVVWYGKTGRLQRSLRNAQSYKEYIEIAKKLDRHLEKYWADDKYYDAKLLQRITQMLSKARVQAEKAAAEQGSSKKAQATAIALADVLRQGALRANTGGWENIHAWAQTYAEPAKVVDEYVAEVVASINRLQKSQHLTTAEKRNVLRQIARQQGRAALCLSGGAAMGWKHLGVLRGLLDAGCLPQAVSGASAGALMAALVGTHLDVELRCILRPEMAKYVTMCQGDFWAQAQRWMRLGHWFDAIEWAPRTQMFTRGSLTFEEAYARTGRVLCITATPQNVRHAQGQLLNYMTTPNVVIWSAVIASASLPGAIQPVVLLAKNRDGQIVPYTDSGIEWRDGSFCSDVPRSLLKTLLNVQFTVVSQVNPHVTLFFYARNGAVGLPVCNWRGRGIAVAMEHILKLDICKWLRLLSDLNLTPPRQQDWARVWLQKFEGSITILPHAHLGEYLRLLRDPTPASLARSMHVGKSATWPALRLIQARLAIENAITDAWINVCNFKGRHLWAEDLWTG